jgi:hypothetical protein
LREVSAGKFGGDIFLKLLVKPFSIDLLEELRLRG